MNTILMTMTFASFLIALGIHYSAQAAAAAALGDRSLLYEGRMSLNPLRHASPIGTVVALTQAFPFVGLPFGFGWGRIARPDPRRFRSDPDVGLCIYALSGILANILTGILVALLIGILAGNDAIPFVLNRCSFFTGGDLQSCLQPWQPGWILRIEQFAFVFGLVNIMVGLLNLIPLYPLDGYHLLFALLPDRTAFQYRQSAQTQEYILVMAVFLLPLFVQFGLLPSVLNPINLFYNGSAMIMELCLRSFPAGLFLRL
jgi:Zn-dependent protease